VPHSVGHEGPYGPRAACHGAADGAVGTDEDRARGTVDLVSLRYLPVPMQQHASQPVLVSLGPIIVRITPAHERDGQLRGVVFLPVANLWQEGVARSAARVCKDQHHRLARNTQSVKRERLAVET
jgi:hypothetical protein